MSDNEKELHILEVVIAYYGTDVDKEMDNITKILNKTDLDWDWK